MENLQAAVKFYREQAEIIYVLALEEKDTNRRRVLLAICEHYYLLHDQLQELAKIPLPGDGVAGRRARGLPLGLPTDFFAVSRDPFAALSGNDNHEPLELTYVVDGDGKVIACEIDSWMDFSLRNGGEKLASAVGLNVFAACADVFTASTYRIIHALLAAGKLDQYSFNFRCDSPDRARLFRMTLRPHAAGPGGAVIYRSELLRERERAPVALLGAAVCHPDASDGAVKLCSFCQCAWEPASARWVEADAHPAAHDDSARVRACVCEDCHHRIVGPLIELADMPGMGDAGYAVSRD